MTHLTLLDCIAIVAYIIVFFALLLIAALILVMTPLLVLGYVT